MMLTKLFAKIVGRFSSATTQPAANVVVGPSPPRTKPIPKPGSDLVYHDPTFGDFIYDRTVGWFETNRLWNGRDIRVSLTTEEEDVDEAKQIAEFAHGLWSDEAEWLARLEACAIRDLHRLANEWQEDVGPVSEAQFCSRISPKSVTFWGTEEFDFWFDDGDLFWGHGIMVSGNVNAGPQNASIQG